MSLGSQEQQTPPVFLTPTLPEQMTPPVLDLTPSVSSGPSRSVSPRMMSVGSAVANEPDQAPESISPAISNEPKCRYCLHIFSDHNHLNQHLNRGRCTFAYRPGTHIDSEYKILRRPVNYTQTQVILQQLPRVDRIRMCQLNSWVMPGLWPLVFPGNLRQSGEIPPILQEMTASNNSTEILIDLLRSENEVQLPKQIILIDTARNIKSVLPTRVLTPGSRFVTTVSGDSITVSLGNIYRKYQWFSQKLIFLFQ